MIETSATAVRGQAFGLDLRADFAIPGLPDARADAELPDAVLHLADGPRIDARWPTGEATRILAEGSDIDPDRTIDGHPDLGYRLFARYFGLCLVAPAGERLLCAPPPVPTWRWQRFLVGRCLPLAAMLRGYEVFHAGAVAIDGGVVAIVGPSGAGKTSLVLHLTVGGAGFVTDDVLVLDEDLRVHPGFGVVNLRAGEDERLESQARDELGAFLGQTGHDKRHYLLRSVPASLPLAAVYFLLPAADEPAATIAPLAAPEPLRLLTSTFIHQVRPAPALARLLATCARMAADVPMFEVRLGAAEGAAALAGRLGAHAAERASR